MAKSDILLHHVSTLAHLLAHPWQDWGARCNASANFDRYLVTHYFRPAKDKYNAAGRDAKCEPHII